MFSAIQELKSHTMLRITRDFEGLPINFYPLYFFDGLRFVANNTLLCSIISQHSTSFPARDSFLLTGNYNAPFLRINQPEGEAKHCDYSTSTFLFCVHCFLSRQLNNCNYQGLHTAGDTCPADEAGYSE